MAVILIVAGGTFALSYFLLLPTVATLNFRLCDCDPATRCTLAVNPGIGRCSCVSASHWQLQLNAPLLAPNNRKQGCQFQDPAVLCYPALLLFHFVMLMSSMMFTAVPRT